MKILYVTGMCGPIEDILSGKKEDEITHGYQFFQPWWSLVQHGHQVDFVIASNFNKPFDIKVDWFSPKNIYANVYDPFTEVPWYRRIFRRIRRLLLLFYYTNRAVRENHYDFIYGKAFYEGLVGNIVANFYGIPCGMRSMGTKLNEDFKRHGVWKTALMRPAEFITFKIKKNFFLMTDDGTRGDIVYEKWKPKSKKYDYLFWKTGVKIKKIDDLKVSVKKPSHPYLFFAARFEDWKRHDRILKVLHLLHQKGIKMHLYFAGSDQFASNYKKIVDIVEKLELAEHVHFMGKLMQDDLRFMAYNATANPTMYDISNLGNVFFEIFSTGAVVIGLNDGTLNDFLKNEENGFLVDDEKSAANVIERIMNEKYDVEQIRKSAIECAMEKVVKADERYQREVQLIEDCVQAGDS